ncbi:MAG: hypothetical protein RM021_009785 [Nostoc sp. EkiNYC01]|nr:hypothetical protein [Nostoc sp. EkiNYC01]
MTNYFQLKLFVYKQLRSPTLTPLLEMRSPTSTPSPKVHRRSPL